MTADQLGGPAQLVLTASVARRYYMDGRSKVEIANEFGLSRFKVARLLDLARATGLVRIEIGHPGTIDVDLSGQLKETFGLRHSVVVDTPDDDEASLRQHLGRAAADLLTEVVTAEDVLGLAWGRSVLAAASALHRLPPVAVVQLTGALTRPDGAESSVDVVRTVARIGGGPAYVFYAPFLVSDPSTARALRNQPDVARAFRKIPDVTRALCSVGLWAPGLSTLYEAADDRERRRLRRAGVCADVGGVFVKADGTPVQTTLSERMVGITADQLAAIPEVIGIPYGTAKAPAVRAALSGRLVSGLVTHTSLAHALLSDW